MGHVVAMDAEGHLVYEGLLSSQEKASIDNILSALQKEIPQIESDLKDAYGNSVLYKYNLGKFLGELLNRYDITISERRKFWDEIKTFATAENRTRNEGKNSKTRSFYEQCYMLSQQDIETVKKLSWKRWQSLWDRVKIREDKRIFDWIKATDKMIDADWPEFEKGLNLYLQQKDTSVFTDAELFEIYDSIMEMSRYWRIAFAKFKKDFPASEKAKKGGQLSKKYQKDCFQLAKSLHKPLDAEIFEKAFKDTIY